jgi:hypothetical protein
MLCGSPGDGGFPDVSEPLAGGQLVRSQLAERPPNVAAVLQGSWL